MHETRILITGGAGFLGSAILNNLIDADFAVLAVKRSTTKLNRCEAFKNHVQWIDTGEDFVDKSILFNPHIIIHAAWSGVKANERSDWGKQLQNFSLFADLLRIAQQSTVKKIIVLGSQAEYGNPAVQVNENSPAAGSDAYASCKQAMQNLLERYCSQFGQTWYWLRVFSVYGPGEDENWFIPYIITNQLKGVATDLTKCEQQYDYLFIKDFAAMIETIVSTQEDRPGVYNVCSGRSVALRTIAETIKEEVNNKTELNFGVLPYRLNQSMYIGGDNSKFEETFGKTQEVGLHQGIKLTVDYYKERFEKERECYESI